MAPDGSSQPPRIRRRILRWSRRCVLAGVLLICAVLLYLNWIGVPGFVRARLERALQARGLTVELPEVRLRGFRTFVATNIELKQSSDSTGATLLVPEAELKLKSGSLRRLRVDIETVLIQRSRLVWPVTGADAAGIPLSVDNMNGELRLLDRDAWELRSFDGQFQGARFHVSGLIEHASGMQRWLSRPPARERRTPSRMIERVLAQIRRTRLEPHSRIAFHITGDGRDPSSFGATLDVRLPEATMPWGAITDLALVGTLKPSERTNELLTTSWQLRLGEAVLPGGRVQALEISGLLSLSATNFNLSSSSWTGHCARVEAGLIGANDITLHGATAPSSNRSSTLETDFRAGAGLVESPFGSVITNHFSAALFHSATNIAQFQGGWRWRVQEADLRWGRSRDVELSGQVASTDPARITVEPDVNWGAWALLAPFEFDWAGRLNQIQSPELNVESLSFGGRWRAPELSIPELKARLYGGGVQGAARLDVATRRLSAESSFDFDVQKIAPLLTTNAQRWLDQFTWESSPRVTGSATLVLPPWTNQVTLWRKEVMPTIELAGSLETKRGTFRKIAVESARSSFTMTNLLWRMPDLVVTRPEGLVHLQYIWHLQTQEYFWDIRSAVDPQALEPVLTPPERRALAFFKFTQPPKLQAQLLGRWHNRESIGFSGHVTATNFTFRGEQCDEFSGSLDYTNRFLHFSQVQVRQGSQIVSAPSGGYDPIGHAVFVTNATSNMDPDLITRVIGPKTREAIEPYRFATPPTVRVNGRLPTRDVKTADAKFEITGSDFRYWKFQTPAVSGDVVWRDNSVTITNVQARFYNGRLQWQGFFDFAGKTGTHFRFNGKVSGADLKPLMQDLVPSTNQFGGTLNGSVDITSGNSADWKSWFGFGEARLSKGFLWNIPVFGFLSSWLNKISPGLGNNPATDATGTFKIEHSVIHTRDLEIKSPALRLQYEGSVDFDGNVDARVRAELLRDVGWVGRAVSIVLWPISKILEYKVTGSLNHPKSEPMHIPEVLLLPFQPVRKLKELMTPEPPRASPNPSSAPVPAPESAPAKKN